MQTSQKVIVVVGPTASGKSDFAVKLAHKVNGEIISADSRQVYKGLDIGSGKITTSEMRGVPHHMLDVFAVGDDVSVATYKAQAMPILLDILHRGKTPIICGGTGQYVDALITQSQLPEVTPNKALREALEKKSKEELFLLLTQKDPLRASTIDKHNPVRLIRALEIIESLGTVPEQKTPTPLFATTIYLMSPKRSLLKERIEKRLLARLSNGMIEEGERLLASGITHAQLFRLGLEYRYLSLYLEKKLSYEAMKEELLTKIYHYAKRQETWNKKYKKEAIIVDVA